MMFSTPGAGRAPPCAPTTQPSFPTPLRPSTPCRSVVGKSSYGGGPTTSSWRRTSGRTAMPWFTGKHSLLAAETACERLAAAERRSAVHARQAGEERGMGNSMCMRM